MGGEGGDGGDVGGGPAKGVPPSEGVPLSSRTTTHGLPLPLSLEGDADKVTEFLREVDVPCARKFLYNLPPEAHREVMKRGPVSTARCPSAALQSRMLAHDMVVPVETVVLQYGIKDEFAATLRALDPSKWRRVMQQGGLQGSYDVEAVLAKRIAEVEAQVQQDIAHMTNLAHIIKYEPNRTPNPVPCPLAQYVRSLRTGKWTSASTAKEEVRKEGGQTDNVPVASPTSKDAIDTLIALVSDLEQRLENEYRQKQQKQQEQQPQEQPPQQHQQQQQQQSHLQQQQQQPKHPQQQQPQQQQPHAQQQQPKQQPQQQQQQQQQQQPKQPQQQHQPNQQQPHAQQQQQQQQPEQQQPQQQQQPKQPQQQHQPNQQQQQQQPKQPQQHPNQPPAKRHREDEKGQEGDEEDPAVDMMFVHLSRIMTYMATQQPLPTVFGDDSATSTRSSSSSSSGPLPPPQAPPPPPPAQAPPPAEQVPQHGVPQHGVQTAGGSEVPETLLNIIRSSRKKRSRSPAENTDDDDDVIIIGERSAHDVSADVPANVSEYIRALKEAWSSS